MKKDLIKCQKCNEKTKKIRRYNQKWLCFKCYSKEIANIVESKDNYFKGLINKLKWK